MKVAVLGYGSVGKGVVDMINACKDMELGLVLMRAGKDTEPFMTSDFNKILSDEATTAVAECMGEIEPAFTYLKAALLAGKDVVTANKALIAQKGLELNEAARSTGARLLFSAACGGAIPLLHNVFTASQTDTITSCRGIINGTTNFILSGIKDGTFPSYKEALAQAQKLGYAEADPTADVSGLDTLRKVVLMSAVAFNKLPVSGMNLEGIENCDLYSDGGVVKLIGQTGLNADGSVYAFVQPVICKDGSAFAGVGSNFNMISYVGKNCGEISIMGQGAGRYPTASAVLRDLSSLPYGGRSMLSDSCVSVEANNSLVEFDYVVFKNGEKAVVRMSVKSMHEWAEKEREQGSRIFFAAEEE